MAKYEIFLEQNDKGEDTGRFQVAEEDADFVLETFATEKEAEAFMARVQAESDRDDKIKAEYLDWEKACLSRHDISEDDLRVYLVNVVIT